MKEKKIYLPGLNGLRTIAALGVLISHITIATKEFGVQFYPFGKNAEGNPEAYLWASYGVTIFFALSGFLITYLLLLEKKVHTIDVKKFYFRRILRIWPLYYLALVVAILMLYLAGQHTSIGSVFYYIFFIANIPLHSLTIPILSHYWSLAVEEQFYLFWPWIIGKVKNNLFRIILVLIILQNLIRIWLWYKYPYSEVAIFSLVNRFDCMMIGGLGAIIYESENLRFNKIFNNKPVQIFALSILALLIINKFHINAIIDNFVIAIITVIIIFGQINVKNRIINFDTKILNFFGKISFGLYVYHPLIIFLFSLLYKNMVMENSLKIVAIYLSIIFTTILVAHLSYKYFETPFVKYKSKFAIIKSTASKIV